jgi:putative flippase GtrA
MTHQRQEVIRYGINGLMATCAHYAVLTVNLKIFGFTSAGMANLTAALFGIAASFLGSRYYVFREASRPISQQLVKFGALYGMIAMLHGLILFIWTDIFGLDYRLGFIVATALQIGLSYFGNKYLVFKK